MPRCGDGRALAERLGVSGLRRTRVERGDDTPVVSVQRLPPPDLADRGHPLRLHPSAPAPVVPRHVSPDAEQAGHLQRRVGPPPRREAVHGVENQAQAGAGDDGTRRRQAVQRAGGDRRRLPGRRAHRRQTWPRCPGQDAVRGRCRNHARGQAGASEAAPGRQLLIAGFAKRSLDPTCAVVSDGLACFGAVKEAGCQHEVIKTGSGPAAARVPAFKWVNTALGNIKAAIVGTDRAIHEKHVPRYLAEFEYRFNRRYDLAAMRPRLTWAAVRPPPMPYRLLKLPDVYA